MQESANALELRLSCTKPSISWIWIRKKPILLLQWWHVDFPHNLWQPNPKCAQLLCVCHIDRQLISDIDEKNPWTRIPSFNLKCIQIYLLCDRIYDYSNGLLTRFACGGPHMKLWYFHNNFSASYYIEMDCFYVNCCKVMHIPQSVWDLYGCNTCHFWPL